MVLSSGELSIHTIWELTFPSLHIPDSSQDHLENYIVLNQVLIFTLILWQYTHISRYLRKLYSTGDGCFFMLFSTVTILIVNQQQRIRIPYQVIHRQLCMYLFLVYSNTYSGIMSELYYSIFCSFVLFEHVYYIVSLMPYNK